MLLSRLKLSASFAYHLRGQARFPFLDLDQIKRAQERRVRRMVLHAYRTVPYYRDTMTRLGLLPSDFRTADDLAKLPILERDQLQRDPEYFVSTFQPLSSYIKLRSGGSEGAPRTVYHNAGALFENVAHGERDRSMVTALIGKWTAYRQTLILGPISSAKEVREFCDKHELSPKKLRIQRQYVALTDPVEKNIRLINQFKPDLIHSYGSYLEVLFPYLHNTGVPFHYPKAITYSSDGLSDAVKDLIVKTFKIPVFGNYQAIEAFKIGFECDKHIGLHNNMDLYPVRIINGAGNSLPAGMNGDVVISNLVNKATVLLNYRLGDIAHYLPDVCPCGRSLPVLSFMEGRSDDWIQLPSGRSVHSQLIRTIFTNEEQVWQYQVFQESIAHLRVAIVAAANADRRTMHERISSKFVQLFGEGARIEISFVDQLPRTEAGKTRVVLARKINR